MCLVLFRARDSCTDYDSDIKIYVLKDPSSSPEVLEQSTSRSGGFVNTVVSRLLVVEHVVVVVGCAEEGPSDSVKSSVAPGEDSVSDEIAESVGRWRQGTARQGGDGGSVVISRPAAGSMSDRSLCRCCLRRQLLCCNSGAVLLLLLLLMLLLLCLGFVFIVLVNKIGREGVLGIAV